MAERPVQQPSKQDSKIQRANQAQALLEHNAPTWLFEVLKATNNANNQSKSIGESGR